VELNKDVVCHRFCSTCSQYLAKGALEGFGGSKTEGQVIQVIMKYTDDLLKIAKQ
jgi:hypothetical protein